MSYHYSDYDTIYLKSQALATVHHNIFFGKGRLYLLSWITNHYTLKSKSLKCEEKPYVNTQQ